MDVDHAIYDAMVQSVELKARLDKLKAIAKNELYAKINVSENEVKTSDKIKAMKECVAIEKFIKIAGYIDGTCNNYHSIAESNEKLLEYILSVLR